MSDSVQPAAAYALKTMRHEDGRISYYLDHPDFYAEFGCDGGKWSAFVRDPKGAEGFAEQAQPVPPATGCACKWQGDVCEARCELHEAWHVAIHEWADRAKAAEAKLAQPPQGYRLMPLEATDAMMKAAGHVNSEWLNEEAPIGDDVYAMPMKDVYAAFLAAAPEPEPEAQPGGKHE